MSITSAEGPASVYQAALHEGVLLPDAKQLEVVTYLQNLHDELLRGNSSGADALPQGRRIFARLLNLWLPRQVDETKLRLKGLYIWGGVGRGKTLLCDMFYENLPIQNKKRLHFHRFMQGVHDELRRVNDQRSPLEIVAEKYAGQYRVLVLDEMHINDITDAMLMSGLLTGLFSRNVVIVTTSNSRPDDLYRDGLQRARFLPAIAALNSHTNVVHLGGDVDYRLRALEAAEIYHTPVDEAGERVLAESFKQAVSPAKFSTNVHIEINDREIRARQLAEHVVWFDFSELCMTARSTADYIEIAKRFDTVMVSGVTKLSSNNTDVARRFINLIDEFYDRNVKLIVTAEALPEQLYEGTRLAFEFERTASRLREMQSRDYLSSKHLQ